MFEIVGPYLTTVSHCLGFLEIVKSAGHGTLSIGRYAGSTPLLTMLILWVILVEDPMTNGDGIEFSSTLTPRSIEHRLSLPHSGCKNVQELTLKPEPCFSEKPHPLYFWVEFISL